MKEIGTDIANKTTDFVTEAADFVTTEAADFVTDSKETVNTARRKLVLYDDDLDDDHTLVSTKNGQSNSLDETENSGRVRFSEAQSKFLDETTSSATVRFSEASPSKIRTESGTLLRRSEMMRNLKESSDETRTIMVPKNSDDFNDVHEIENNLKWKRVAARVDDVARFWIPTTFIVALCIVLSEAF